MPAAAHRRASEPAEATETIAATEFFGETLDEPGPTEPARSPQNGISLFVAGHRTTAQRYSDFYLTSGKPRRRPVAASMRLRRADDRNFTNRTRWLGRRLAEIGRPAAAAQLGVATTGEEFLDTLVAASRDGPIANLVVYGHAAPNALFMREDRGFYGAVMEVAKVSHIVSGEEIEKDEQLRLAGARDVSDFEQLVARGDDQVRAQRRDRVRRLRRRGQARHRAGKHRGTHGRDHRREGDRLDRRDRPVDDARAESSATRNIRAAPGCASCARSRPSG